MKLRNKIESLLGKVEARTVASICKIATSVAAFAVLFTMYPAWHEEAEMPKSLLAKLR